MKNPRLVLAALVLTAAGVAGCNSTQKTSSSSAETKSAETTMVDTTKPVNAKCPMMGTPVKDGVTVAYHEKTVGFCCAGCASKWSKLTDTEKDTKLAAAMK